MSQLSLFDHCEIARTSDKPTSKEAAKRIEPKLSGLRAMFVKRLLELDRPATANEVAVGYESLRKRAIECVKAGVIREIGTKRCDVTGEKATAYWVV